LVERESDKMKIAKEIILECSKLITPNLGVEALAERALQDDQFCIMDNKCDRRSYREECLDSGHCITSDFMLACVATRKFGNEYLIGDEAIGIYSNAIK